MASFKVYNNENATDYEFNRNMSFLAAPRIQTGSAGGLGTIFYSNQKISGCYLSMSASNIGSSYFESIGSGMDNWAYLNSGSKRMDGNQAAGMAISGNALIYTNNTRVYWQDVSNIGSNLQIGSFTPPFSNVGVVAWTGSALLLTAGNTPAPGSRYFYLMSGLSSTILVSGIFPVQPLRQATGVVTGAYKNGSFFISNTNAAPNVYVVNPTNLSIVGSLGINTGGPMVYNPNSDLLCLESSDASNTFTLYNGTTLSGVGTLQISGLPGQSTSLSIQALALHPTTGSLFNLITVVSVVSVCQYSGVTRTRIYPGSPTDVNYLGSVGRFYNDGAANLNFYKLRYG